MLGAVAAAGYDGVDLDAEPDRIEHARFEEVREIARSLGLEVPALLAAWGRGHAGEARDLGSADEDARAYAVSYTKKCVDLSARVGRPAFEIAAVPGLGEEYMQPVTPSRRLAATSGARSPSSSSMPRANRCQWPSRPSTDSRATRGS